MVGGLYNPSKGPNPFPTDHLAAAVNALPINNTKSRIGLWIGLAFLGVLITTAILVAFIA